MRRTWSSGISWPCWLRPESARPCSLPIATPCRGRCALLPTSRNGLSVLSLSRPALG
jgi:hypothetical protein